MQPNKKKETSIRRKKKHSGIIIKENGNDSEFNKLSDDLLTYIFLKCPVKTLLISRCISKSWNEFIVSPMFVGSHQKQQLMENGPQLLSVGTLRYSPRSSRLKHKFVSFDMKGRNEELYTINDYPDRQNRSCIMTVCAGLVCICISTTCRIYLCNPAIHQLRELPRCSPSAVRAFELFGFGYLHSKNEYKVVHFFYMGPFCSPLDVELAQLRCEVFTLTSRGISNSRWKEIAEPPPCHPFLQLGLLVNACMYWLASHKRQYPAQP